MPESSPTVFVVDDDLAVREALEGLIQVAGWTPRTFASGQAFLASPPASGPSCLVLDFGLPDLTGLDVQALVARDRSDMPIIFISGYSDVPMTVRAMKAGAVEFLTKPFGEDVLLAAVTSALERSQAVVGEQTALRALRARYATLSRREREVMSLVASGLQNKQVGGELGISEITVKAHRGRAMRKMKARSLADLVTLQARLQPAAG
ncbi:response regulator transcription factor [Phenylobacterium sp.]|uniref:response regulator transcription factor n=1 Tax=Phenylobacterium sp. TaxID=1871053 RepID=UPI003569B6EA